MYYTFAMTMTKYYFKCPKCGRTITAKAEGKPVKPILFLDLTCFTRAGVGCGNWAGRMSSSKAFKTQTINEKLRKTISGRSA